MKKNKAPTSQLTTLDQRNELLRKWLKSHDLFNVAAICRRLPYDRGAFSRFLEGHSSLSEHFVDTLESMLIEYGYRYNILNK